MRRGEIWWGDLPGAGHRPALILTRDIAIPLLGRVLVAPLTRSIRGLPTEVLLEEADGVPYRSAVSLDNLQAVSKRRLGELITRLTDAHLSEVCEALRFAVAC